jgi:hypothetical protein
VIARSVLAVALVAAGCSGSKAPTPSADAGPPPICPHPPVAVCPSPAPDLVADVQPILQAKCSETSACHGHGTHWELHTRTDLIDWWAGVYSDLLSCKYPPRGYPQLTPTEQSTLLAWLRCNRPTNPVATDGGDASP